MTFTESAIESFDSDFEMEMRKASTKLPAATSSTTIMRKHTVTPPTSDRQERASFASFKEDRNAVAQSFIDNKTSSYARGSSEDAIDDSSSEHQLFLDSANHRPLTLNPGMSLTNPSSNLHGFICPCEGFRGWKQISVGGKLASRSFGDLRTLSRGFSWEPSVSSVAEVPIKRVLQKGKPQPGESGLEQLPIELLSKFFEAPKIRDLFADSLTGEIIDQLVTDIPPNGYTPRNIDLMSLLLTSRALHSATLATLYSQITIPHSTVFRKFLAHITAHPSLGTIVRRLDFSHFNPIGAEMTARERSQTQNLTSTTLLQCLDLLPNLREFLAQEHIDEDLSAEVITKLLNMPRLRAIDFCASSSGFFRDSMLKVFRSSSSMDLPSALPIARLSFHGCTILPAAIFESLLPRLPKLTHLDLTHTRVTDAALASISKSARLTHLSLSKCSSLSGDAVVNFLSNHPAARSLVYLNLLMDAKSHEMLSAVDITALLPNLPSTLRSLNLKGSSMSKNHLPLLLPLSKHLEELGIGRHVSYTDFSSLLSPPNQVDDNNNAKDAEEWVPHTLRYLDISDVESVDLDLGLLFGSRTSILKSHTLPLEVVEVGAKLYDRLKDREHIFKSFGWVVKEAGRRGWLVRDMGKLVEKGEVDVKQIDDGRRSWKMGAAYWGMRKVPVAVAEVGGMYGLYMFKR